MILVAGVINIIHTTVHLRERKIVMTDDADPIHLHALRGRVGFVIFVGLLHVDFHLRAAKVFGQVTLYCSRLPGANNNSDSQY
jgi:hypothetical protein